jgi:type I restriction enzyme R subunit
LPYSESDTRANHIDPALNVAGWLPVNIRREHYFTDGRKLFGGKRGKRCFLDYLLIYNNTFIGIIEAKSEDKEPTEGLQQAIEYALKLKIRFVFSTNGKKIYEFDVINGKGDYVADFPSPQDLYNKAIGKTTPLKEELLKEPFQLIGSMQPRYYQQIAVQKVMEAIGDGSTRVLLTLATGTGKTFIAYQVTYKLYKTKWNIDGADRRPKILFLADRNILVDQAINTFNPFEKDLVKIDGSEIRARGGKVPTNAYIFFAIYQAISEKEDIGGYYKEYPSDFFDIIIIDECHRGSANEAGSWRAILKHFEKAVHVGLTATPKRDDNVDTYNYFGKPVYEYSLKDGINDGFLTPYKVKRVKTNLDEYIYTNDDKVVKGAVNKPVYDISDFDRNIIIPARTEMIAKAILDNIKPMDKTIVFCVDQNHALQMRDCINKHKEINDPQYCVRITSDEGEIGRQLLERFQDNDKDTPVILTSSQMLTTGVDARNVRNIVLARTINSIVEFKQIIGRGTRLFEGKDFFTIIDFTGASNRFYDKDWDGPSIDEEPGGKPEPKKREQKPYPPDDEPPTGPSEPESPKYEKLEVELSNGRKLKVIDVEVRYIGEDGKPVSAKEFLDQLIKVLPGFFDTEDTLRTLWANPDSRDKLLNDLATVGFDQEQLDTLTEMFKAKDSDYYDLLSYLSFNKDIISRRQRVAQVRNDKAYFDAMKVKRQKSFYNSYLIAMKRWY